MSEESLSNIIKELVSKYQNNTTIFNKLIQHVEQLPDLLEVIIPHLFVFFLVTCFINLH